LLSKKFIADSSKFFEQEKDNLVNKEFIREATHNAVGFFELLENWKSKNLNSSSCFKKEGSSMKEK
jgi:hypothetical protein